MEPVAGIPLLRHVAQQAIAVAPTYVALPALDHPRAAALDGLDVTGLPIPDAAQGMGVTLRNAVAMLPKCDGMLLVLGDMPNLTSADMRLVIGAAPLARGVDASGIPGHPVWFDADFLPEFKSFGGDVGAKQLLKNNPVRRVPLPDDHATCDLDTPEDWAKYKQTLT